jgi:hypothetical protein
MDDSPIILEVDISDQEQVRIPAPEDPAWAREHE